MPYEVKMAELPPCNMHPDRVAKYDFKSRMGPWMYGCEECFHRYGFGLGTGKGQLLVLREKSGER